MTVSKTALTAAGEEDLNGDILQQVPTWEDGSHLWEIPLAMQMVAILQHLKQETDNWNIHVPTDYKSGNLNFLKPSGPVQGKGMAIPYVM